MRRRMFLGSAAAASLALTAPAIAQRTKTIKFIPLGELAVLDPIRAPAKVTLHHAYMVYDTLYGMDEAFNVQPQMVEGHRQDGDLVWELMLREGLRFHDGEPVRGRDVVASIRRWAGADALGARLLARTDELSAPSDRMIRFRLKQPFPLLPLALGKLQPNMLAIMPERLASVPVSTPLTEVVGSGPFRYVAAERVPGARVVYEKNSAYVPRQGGTPSQTAGPKIVNVDRVEWNVVPEPTSAMAALMSGEMDWWERPIFDLLPTMSRNKDLVIWKNDPLGEVSTFVMNHGQPPFDKPAIRQALLGAFSQSDVMQAVAGEDQTYWKTGTGWLPAGSLWANNAGQDALKTRSPADVKAALAAAGYAGEKVVLMIGSDIPDISSAGQVVADALGKAGINLDVQVIDWGTVVQRRISRKPLAEGGYSAFVVPTPGYYIADPATAPNLRGTGQLPANGFTSSEAIEGLYGRWIDLPDDASKRALAPEFEAQYGRDVPFVPLGQYFLPTVHRRSLSGMVPGGLIKFWGVTKA